jgi:hypothetical protein
MVAMNLRRLGVCDKFIQQILCHTNVTTTMNIYVKSQQTAWHKYNSYQLQQRGKQYNKAVGTKLG